VATPTASEATLFSPIMHPSASTNVPTLVGRQPSASLDDSIAMMSEALDSGFSPTPSAEAAGRAASFTTVSVSNDAPAPQARRGSDGAGARLVIDGTGALTLSPSRPLALSPSHPLTLSPSHPLTCIYLPMAGAGRWAQITKKGAQDARRPSEV